MDEQHKFCPNSADSWCKYWIDSINGTQTYSEENRLAVVFKEELKPIFERFSDAELLGRCFKGLTQNQNKSINNVLWSMCPKTKLCCRQKVLLAVACSILKFNIGGASKAYILKCIGVKPKCNMLLALRRQNSKRVCHSMRKISIKERESRRERRADRKRKVATKISFLSGGFGLSIEPEVEFWS